MQGRGPHPCLGPSAHSVGRPRTAPAGCYSRFPCPSRPADKGVSPASPPSPPTSLEHGYSHGTNSGTCRLLALSVPSPRTRPASPTLTLDPFSEARGALSTGRQCQRFLEQARPAPSVIRLGPSPPTGLAAVDCGTLSCHGSAAQACTSQPGSTERSVFPGTNCTPRPWRLICHE